ncbi:hypothetical protein KLO70_18110 [Clostridioides difficile]|nr:hypothetical protein [Clostridioides difficile]
MNRDISLARLPRNDPRLSITHYHTNPERNAFYQNYDNVMNHHLRNFDNNIIRVYYERQTPRLLEVNDQNNILRQLIERQVNSSENLSYEIDCQRLTVLLRESKLLYYKKKLILDNPLQTGLSEQEFEAVRQYLEEQDRIIRNNLDVLDRLLYGYEPEVIVEDNKSEDEEDSDDSDNNEEGDNGDTNMGGSSEGPDITSSNESFNNSLNIVTYENTQDSLSNYHVDIISNSLNDILLSLYLDNTFNLLLNFLN